MSNTILLPTYLGRHASVSAIRAFRFRARARETAGNIDEWIFISDANFKYLSKMSADEQLDEYVLNGQSLLDLPSDNATYLSVKAIMKATGYIKQYPSSYVQDCVFEAYILQREP